MTGTTLHLTHAAVVSSVGHTVQSTYASVRAGISLPSRLGVVGLSGALLGAPVIEDLHTAGAMRARLLLTPALAESRALFARFAGKPTALLVCQQGWEFARPFRALPLGRSLESLAHSWHEVPLALVEEIESAGLRLTIRESFALGQCGIFAALDRARALLADHGIDQIVIAAVSSLVEPAVLEALDLVGWSRSKLRSEGFLPSEGAVILGLEKEGEISLGPVGKAPRLEPDGRASALTEATAFAATQARCEVAVVDDNGERFRAVEGALWRLRSPNPPERLLKPIESTGHAGAASGALQLAMAFAELSVGAESAIVTESALGHMSAAVSLSRGVARQSLLL